MMHAWIEMHARERTLNQLLCLLSIPPSKRAITVQDFCSMSSSTDFAANNLATLATYDPLENKKYEVIERTAIKIVNSLKTDLECSESRMILIT